MASAKVIRLQMQMTHEELFENENNQNIIS
jgi:hypothetical protein